MKARYIFNARRNIWAGSIYKMAYLAAISGYNFFLFNDLIYYTGPDFGILQTNLKREDIIYFL